MTGLLNLAVLTERFKMTCLEMSLVETTMCVQRTYSYSPGLLCTSRLFLNLPASVSAIRVFLFFSTFKFL